MAQIFETYLSYVEDTESPKIFHRWSFLSACAASLGRKIYLPFGTDVIYPNLYIILTGVPATRKSSAIGVAQKLLADSGYSLFAANKTSKQKFLLDWEEACKSGHDLVSLLDDSAEASLMYICADEFMDFIGMGNFDFLSLLTTLWDNKPSYEERVKNSMSACIYQPTLNVLGGATPASLALALPKEAAGQGFMSRVIFVYSEPSGRKITFPKLPDQKLRLALVTFLSQLAETSGEVSISPEARGILDKIYHRWANIFDIKLDYYAGRRFTQLLKICMILSAASGTLNITPDIVIQANTYLLQAERCMDKALMEFGGAKNLEATNRVLQTIAASPAPMTAPEIWKHVSSYFEKLSDLAQALQNLLQAEKIINHNGALIALKRELPDFGALVDFKTYTPEELKA